MPYRSAKISFDGSHYIATPKENFPRGKKRRAVCPQSPKDVEIKEQFETAYKESQKLPRKERKEYVKKAMSEFAERMDFFLHIYLLGRKTHGR